MTSTLSTAVTPSRPAGNKPAGRAKGGERIPKHWIAISIFLFFLVWWLASIIAGFTSPGLVPGPFTVAGKFAELCVTQFAGLTLPMHVLSSLGRWGLGVGVAVVLGIPFGVMFGAVPDVRSALGPVFEFLRYIPPFAWIPLAILWMGAGETSAAFIVFVAAFPAVVISTQVGIVNVDPRLPRASINLGAGRVRTILNVVSPVALPSMLSGVRVAASNGWMALIAAEMIGGTQGVGFLIIQGQQGGSVTVVMAAMAAIGMTGAAIDVIVNAIGNRMTRWRRISDSGS